MPDLTPFAPANMPKKDPSTGILNLAAPFVGDAVNGLVSLFTAKRNRQNALDDWNRQNEYNSPAAQMQRYKDAGLSPNLIYGQTNTAAPVRSTEMVAPQLDPKNVDVITRSQNLTQQRLQTDNLQKQLEVQDANIALLKANALKTASETDWKNLNTDRLKNNIMPYDFDYYNLRSRQMAQGINNQTVQNEVLSNTAQKIKSDTNLNTQRKALMLQQIANLENAKYWNSLTKAQQIVTGNLIQQNLLNNQNISRDKIGLDRMRLQLQEAGINSNIAAQILSTFK